MGGKFGEERAAQRKTRQAVPGSCLLACFIVTVGGGPLRDGVGGGQAERSENRSEKGGCGDVTLMVPVVAIYSPLGRLGANMLHSAVYTLVLLSGPG